VFSLKGKELVEEVLHTLGPREGSIQDQDVVLALRLLREWDFHLDRNSVGGALYEVLKYTANRNVLESALSPDLALLALGDGYHPLLKPVTEYVSFDSSLLLRILQNQSSWWLNKVEGGKTRLLERSLSEAVAWLRKRFSSDDPSEWKWGKLHTGKFAHFFSKQSILDKIFSLGPYPLPGDNDTPYLTLMVPRKPYDAEGFVPSWRQVFDMSHTDKSFVVHGPGQSGQLGSPHYDDLAERHLEGNLHQFPIVAREVLKAQMQDLSVILLQPSPDKPLQL